MVSKQDSCREKEEIGYLLLNNSLQSMTAKVGAVSMLINTSSMDRIGRALDASTLRQEVIANNIANVDTPGFKRSDVRFEQLLQRELNEFKSTFVGHRTDPRHYVIGKPSKSNQQLIQPEIVTDNKTSMNNNENNVDVDYEMSLMAKNQLYYQTLIQQLNGQIKKVRTAIDGRR